MRLRMLIAAALAAGTLALVAIAAETRYAFFQGQGGTITRLDRFTGHGMTYLPGVACAGGAF